MSDVPLSKLLLTLESGARPKGGVSKYSDGVLSLGAEHLNGRGGFDLSSPKYVPTAFYDSMDKGRVKHNDILIVKDGATTGKVSFVDGLFGKTEVSINEHVFRLAVDPIQADSRFIFHYLSSPKGKAEILSDFRGATVGGISRGFVDKVKVPSLSVPEQRRIATILDKADAIRRKRRQAIDLMNDFLRSVFLEMFGDPITNSKGWTQRRIGDIGDVVTGNTPPRANPEFYGSLIEWIKSDNINTPAHYLTGANEFLSEQGKAVGRTVPKNSVLVTCIAGSPDCIGNAAIANREVAFNQQINAVIPNPECTAEFLYTLFLVSKRIIQAASTNSMKGMVSKSKFENIVIPVPPINLQNKFSECFDKINHSLRNLSASEKEVTCLNCSISADVFDGVSI